MGSEYILVPRPGYDIREVVENPTAENSVIFEYRYGHLERIHPTTPFTLNTFNPKPPPEYYRRERIGKIVLKKIIPKGTFASGASPFVQAVASVVENAGVAEFSEIYRGITDGMRIAPPNRETQTMLKRLVDWMAGKPSYLTFYREGGRKYYRQGIPLDLRPPLHDIVPGVNPIDYAVCDYAESAGMFSYPELRDYMVSTIAWVSADDYLSERVKRLAKHGYLEKIGELYRYARRIDRFL